MDKEEAKERQFQWDDLLARKVMGWQAEPPESLPGAYRGTATSGIVVLNGSPLQLERKRLCLPQLGRLWQPWSAMADAWPLHCQMCARDVEVKARYLHALANLMLDRYGPPSIWTAPLEVLEPADICYAALLALAPADAEVKAALELSAEQLQAMLTLPDGATPATTLVQRYSSPFPTQELAGDISSPNYVRITYQTTSVVGDDSLSVAGALYLDEEGARQLLGQLRLWLGQQVTGGATARSAADDKGCGSPTDQDGS